MEDEYVCVDNLREYVGVTLDFPSPGAFYGVSNLFSLRYLHWSWE